MPKNIDLFLRKITSGPIKNIDNLYYQFFLKIVDLVYPPYPICPVCGREFKPYYENLALCPGCLQKLPLLHTTVCPRCGRPVGQKHKKNLCPECRKEEPVYRYGRAVALYEGPMKEILYAIKYSFRPELARALGTLLAVKTEGVARYDKIDGVIPVPLHREKIKKRGYNQALLMAEPVAASLKKPLLENVLIRIRDTKSQSSLGRRERKTNVSGAFTVVNYHMVTGRKVLLIDDICTTGFTLSECARVLLAAGAGEVVALTAAVGRPDGEVNFK